MIYFLIWCVIGVGLIALILGGVARSSIERFRVRNNLPKSKKNVFNRVGSKLLYYILCLTPIVQLFMILLELFIIVAYGQTTNEELNFYTREEWMEMVRKMREEWFCSEPKFISGANIVSYFIYCLYLLHYNLHYILHCILH